MSSLKVLQVYKEYYPVAGGIENHIRLLCRGLSEGDEFQPTVLVTNQGRQTVQEVLDLIPVIRAGRLATISQNPISLALVSEMARLPADIVHLHFPHPMGEMAYLAAGRGRKMVIYYHSDIVRQQRLLRLYEPLMRMVLQRASRIMVSSQRYAETSLFLGPFASKIDVVPLGINLERFTATRDKETAAIRQAHPGPLILFVGVLRYYKGLHYLIEAMKSIEARLLIIGTGPLHRELRAEVGRKGLQDKVTLMGYVPDSELPRYYRASDVFVLPSSRRSEAYGLSQIEAMASGKPVVCTELGTGTSFVNQHGVTGLVVPPADPSALAEAVNRLLANPDLRRRMGEQARARAMQEFSHQQMVARITDVYHQIMEG